MKWGKNIDFYLSKSGKYVYNSKPNRIAIFWNLVKESSVVKIRLARFGRKKRPFYRIVVTDSRKRRDSGFIEVVGYYNPLTNPKTIEMDLKRVNYWLGVGAQMTDRVSKLKKIYEERKATVAEGGE